MAHQAYEYFTADTVGTLIPASARSLCVFASYEFGPGISDDRIKYCAALASSFDAVLFITNDRGTPVEEYSRLPRGVRFVTCPNQCLDFGMWFRVLKNLDTTHLDRLALVNDSCVLVDTDALGTILEDTQSPFWGMTDSDQVCHHIQSYFLVFEGPALSVLKEFVELTHIEELVDAPKEAIIVRLEIGLSQFMLSRGVALHACFPYQKVHLAPSMLGSYGPNPSYFCWDRLITLGMPLLKKQRHTWPNESYFFSLAKIQR